jgi:hypothetical protein
MKTKHWIFVIGGILALCIALSVAFLRGGEAQYAQVFSDGKLVANFSFAVDQEKTIESEYGINVVTVKSGKIAVTHADCPDGYCMKRGFCSGGTEIVCLPNRLIIRFCAQQEIDAAVG